MKRRAFVFNSMTAAALLSPVIAGRFTSARAQASAPRRAFFWINSTGYPNTEDFFPSGNGSNFELSTILEGFSSVKDELVIMDGVTTPEEGLNPKGNRHISSMGKLLTAKNVLPVDDPENGAAGAASIDQILARDLGVQSLEVQVDDRSRNHMRGRPFATGPRAFKVPIVSPAQAWDKVFRDFSATPEVDTAAQTARMNRLLARKSVLDDLTPELGRFRRSLSGFEKNKLDIHEHAIRQAELSVVRDMETMETPPASICEVPTQPGDVRGIPERAEAHFDLMYAAMLCDRVQIGSMLFGYSGFNWTYEWIGVRADSSHDDIHHRRRERRDDYVRMAQWDWNHYARFIERLRDTPEEGGSMLDNTLMLGTSNFGLHHRTQRIPYVLAGNAKGQLSTGRFIKDDIQNDVALTSFAHLMGLPLDGLGDRPNCGTYEPLMT